ncbi:FAD-binding domain-containing protein [Pseudovibrio exalbescens]|uniref:Deoxyribodipyrimidine photolyase n=1 Tax=Pseudovibrio exalbescens TaxID=197461 RepID=A0A1U7JLJ9_9HYPH|nr:FAD-binding domain-containing protein [Pseudovibrio exalbescens]OKL45568.1 deoxyribodipyrimidine photolyase [Pseudovibrio exalbescens]
MQIVWFKKDLRITDHRPLIEAMQHGTVLPLYVAEPELWQQPDASERQWCFVKECLKELDGDLRKLGQGLILRIGSVTDVLDELKMSCGVAGVWAHEETGNGWSFARDRTVSAWCRLNGVRFHEFPQTGVIRGLSSRDGWARKWDRFMRADILPAPKTLEPVLDEPFHLPTAADLGLEEDFCPGRQRGGRREGQRILSSFLAERAGPYRRSMSSPLSAERHCSRLSPYLAYGCVSMREVAQATWGRQRELKEQANPPQGWRGSLSSFAGRLHWHCHFMQKLEDAPSIEFKNLHPAYDGLRDVSNESVLAAWSAGQTGFPFVDACMRYLRHGGWVNFRMRAMLMAFASYHLWLNWREPGLHLARQFVDYEPGIHWPQVQMQSGTTGINTVRVYNPVKQGYDQDGGGEFVRRWVPELAAVPTSFIHEPWKWEEASSILDKSYPVPIVDHMSAAKAARQKIWALRKSEEFKLRSAAIQTKHGSRKSGLAQVQQKPKASRRKAETRGGDGGQMSFLFDGPNQS